MIARAGGVAGLALLLAAGVALAATRGAQSDDLSICINNGSGLIRAATACTSGETATTIGAGGAAAIGGTVVVAFGESGNPKSLPLTGVTLTPRCILPPPEFGGVFSSVLIQAASGETFDAFLGAANSVLDGTSFSLGIASSNSTEGPGKRTNGWTHVFIRAASGTTAIELGGFVDLNTQTCHYAWQAVEAPAALP